MNENLNRYMDELARCEDNYWWSVGRLAVITKVLHGLLTSRDFILNIGCGSGKISTLLAATTDVINVDYDPYNLAIARQPGIEHYSCADACHLPFSNESVGGIICLDVLEHIEQDRQVMAEMFRVLKPGGWQLITVPAHPWLWSTHDEFFQHFRRYRKKELLEKLTGAGFNIKMLSYFNSLLFPLAVLRKAMERFGRRNDTGELPASGGLVNDILKRVFVTEKYFLPKPGFFWGTSLICLCERVQGQD